jgi:hypothetical protein
LKVAITGVHEYETKATFDDSAEDSGEVRKLQTELKALRADQA